MKRCALLTCDDLADNISDEDRLEAALRAQDWQFEWIPWRQTGVDWNQFDLALIRTTWDYTQDLPLFLNQLKAIEESSCQLVNTYALVQWNADKKYLRELEQKGVAVIPTQWGTVESVEQIIQLAQPLNTSSLVVKPQVGAGAKNTFKLSNPDAEAWQPVVNSLAGEEVMLQPFMEKVVTQGEHSAHFFGGKLSHMVLKTPKDQDFRSQEEFGSFVREVPLSQEQRVFCEKVLASLPEPALYARVDFIHDSQDQPCLIELELIEPSLYFRYAEGAASRLVAALEKLI